jgi:N-methylhydantoinase A
MAEPGYDFGEGSQVRLTIDIGGTFKDFALSHGGDVTTSKVLTTPDAPERAVMAGMQALLGAARIAPADISLLVHGTTLATNAIIERRGARTALVTTEGFRDVLAMGNESRYDQYDLNIVLPQPLVPRHLRLTVPERVDRTGHVLRKLDEQAVRDLVPVLKREGVESVAIGFLHAFVNPAHERRVAEILADALPEMPVSLSSEVSPEIREWERFSTTAANAYVQPLMARYLKRLEADMRDAGMTAPIFLMLSGGKLTTIETACRFPIRLVESGPAGGVIFSASIAAEAGLTRVLSFDMGGTTAKICLVDDYRPHFARSFEVARVGRFRKGSGLPLRIPAIEMVEIGAGGGSLAQVDTLGRIAVGPESAGADPGPACYGRGGDRPAVTDANLVLGRYDPQRFAGGTMRLDEAAACRALDKAVGEPLGLGTGLAALGVVEMVDEAMANAARAHAIEASTSLGGRTLIAFGGGGPVHATRIAEKVGIDRVLVPKGAGVGSAIGFLRAPVGYEVVRSLYQRLGTLDVAAVNAVLEEMAAEAGAAVAAGSFGAPTQEMRMAAMRYVGQGHEITIPLPVRLLTAADIPLIKEAYDAAYGRFYARPIPGSEIEVLSYIVTVETGVAPPPSAPQEPLAHAATPDGARRVRDSVTGEQAQWALFARHRLAAGAAFQGPAIVAEDETSTLVGPGWEARITAQGWILLTRKGQS